MRIRELRGCRSRGGRQYEVAVESLPAELRIKWEQQRSAALETAHLPPVSNAQDRLWQRRLAWITPALEARANGHPAAPTLRAVAAQRGAPSFDTLETWLRRYERDGVAGLLRKPRADAQSAKVLISRQWDAATSALPAEKRTAIVELIEKRVRSLYANGAPGWKHVARLAGLELIEATRAAGVELTGDAAQLPRRFVKACGARYAVLATKEKDAKRFFDKHLPRIQRVRNFPPLQHIAGDVHRGDVLYRRDDGTTATPWLVAWKDLATNRAFARTYFLEKGRAIRQEDVIASFIDMTQDPEWGFPSHLYLDNGGEYNWTPFIEDALAAKRVAGRELFIQHGVTRARPYNAPAKIIESLFAAIERGPFAMVPGWIGGNRMVKKTANVGREPAPYPGSLEELRRAIDVALDYYDTTPQSPGSHLNGKSPREKFNDFVTAGWSGKIAVERSVLETVFASEEPRLVDRGRVRIEGRTYFTDDLLDRTGETVIVRIPRVGDRSRVAVLDREQKLICVAGVEQQFALTDPAGAKEQSRRSGVLNARLRELKAQTEPVDLVAEMARAVAAEPPALPAPIAGTLRLRDARHHEAAARAAISPTPEEQFSREIEERRRIVLGGRYGRKRH